MTCELCGGAGPAEAWCAEKGVVECRACGLVYYDPAAKPQPPAAYDAGYFLGGEYLDYGRDKAVLQRNFDDRIAYLRTLAPGGRLLEIGSAYGFFLERAKAFWSVRGLYISEDAARHGRETLGLDVAHGEFLNLPDEPAAYDLICLWDTIEHLEHPVRTIKKAAKWLKPGGHLVLTTGDVDSWVARIRKGAWRQVHPPTHLYYFSPATLRRAFEDAGLEMTASSHIGHRRDLISMVHGLCLRGGPWAKKLADKLPFRGSSVSVNLNLFDITMATARKPR
jgi:SAM-dependent methyltransferase